jgi:phosphoserine aminotransferase
MAKVADSAIDPIRSEMRPIGCHALTVSDTPLPDITLPDELRPGDGRFGSGPSKVRSEAVAALAEVASSFLGTSHRQTGVKSVVGRIRRGLADLLGLPDGYEVVLGNGGSTLFWDVATLCLIERRSQHLVFGEFSSKFAAAAKAAPFLDDPEVVESEYGTHPEAKATPDVDAYALTHNETSTGVMTTIERPPGSDGGLVLVDATSAAGGLRVDATQFDCYYFAPQKALASDGGLWLAALSPDAVERVARLVPGRWVPAVLDLQQAIDNSRLDQTLNTPALATLFLVAQQLDWLEANGGIDFAAGRCDRSASIVYGWADASSYASPFVSDPAMRSHTVATIDLDASIDAGTVAKVLRNNGIVDTESYRKLGRNQLRLAMFPAIEPDDVDRLTNAIDFIAERLA